MYSMYEEWTECTATCGGGYAFRVRECRDLTGNPDCEESEMKMCNEQPCDNRTGAVEVTFTGVLREQGENIVEGRRLKRPIPSGVPTLTSGKGVRKRANSITKVPSNAD